MKVLKIANAQFPLLMNGCEIETTSRRLPVLPAKVKWTHTLPHEKAYKVICVGDRSGVEVRHTLNMPIEVGEELRIQEPFVITKDGVILYRYDYSDAEAKKYMWQRNRLPACFCKRVAVVTDVQLLPSKGGDIMTWHIKMDNRERILKFAT
jgi:hypothetical protein